MNSAETKKLVQWVQKWAENLDIRHLETPVHDFLRPLVHFRFYHTRLSFRGYLFRGNGADTNPELALLKSIAEVIERSVSIGVFLLDNSTGNAAHFSVEEAEKSARLELLERDAFFSHFLTLTPFFPDAAGERMKKNLSLLEDIGVRADYFRMQSLASDVFTVLCRFQVPIRGKIRSIIATAASGDKAQAQEKAFAEALSLTNTLLHARPEEEVTGHKEELDPWDHIRLVFSDAHAGWFQETFFPARPLVLPGLHRSLNMSYEEYPLKGLPFEDTGLHVVKASAPEVQRAYWGLPKPEVINYERLRLLRPDVSEATIPWDRFHLLG